MYTKCLFVGRPVAKPGSRVYHGLPDWVLQELKEPAGKTARRLRNPNHDPGFTIPEAAELLGYTPMSLYVQIGRWNKNPGKGVPELNKAKLEIWDDYLLEPDRTLRRLPVCSRNQIKSIKAIRDKNDTALRERKGLTDCDLMRRHPDLFAKRVPKALKKRIAQMADVELHPYRPPYLTHWRDKKKGCPYLPNSRALKYWVEGGRIINDPEDIKIIVKNLLGLEEKEWTDPETDVAYFSTRRAEDEGVSKEKLWAHTARTRSTDPARDEAMRIDWASGQFSISALAKRHNTSQNTAGRIVHGARRSIYLPDDGLFHPTYQEIGQRKRRGWPKKEVKAFIAAQKAFQEQRKAKVSNACACIVKMISKGPIKAEEGIKALKKAGFGRRTREKACKRLTDQGKLTQTRTDRYEWLWHPPDTPALSKREQAADFLRSLVSKGPVWAFEAMEACRRQGFSRWLISQVRAKARVLSTFVERSDGQFHVWHSKDWDPDKVQRLTKQELCKVETLPESAGQRTPCQTPAAQTSTSQGATALAPVAGSADASIQAWEHGWPDGNTETALGAIDSAETSGMGTDDELSARTGRRGRRRGWRSGRARARHERIVNTYHDRLKNGGKPPSISELARGLGCDRKTIRNALHKAGIPIGG
jgi:hypothetical protein